MKLIPLTNGEFVKVDDEDYDYLIKYKWYLTGKKFKYPSRKIYKKGVHKTIKLHRDVMSVSDPKVIIDHINHDLLNAQKNNLRKCTRGQNRMNCTSSKNATSNYLGVHFHKKTQKWQAQIRLNYKAIYLGIYASEKEAAKAYDEKAKELFGEFANLNFKD